MTALEIHLGSRQWLRVMLRQTALYCGGDYFLAKYIFSLQFLILISRQNYHLQTRDIVPCGWVPLICKIKKTK